MQKRIAIPCTGEFLNEHFGRAQTFKLIEIVDGKIQNEKTINSRGLEHQHEGIAQLLKQNGVETVICGGIGAGAITGLQKAGLEILKGARGRLLDIAQEYADGTFTGTDTVCNHKENHTYYHAECVCDE